MLIIYEVVVVFVCLVSDDINPVFNLPNLYVPEMAKLLKSQIP